MSVDRTPTWQERADALARTLRLNLEIAERGRPGMTAAELAPLLSEDLRPLYWQRKLDAYFDEQLGDVS